MTGCRRMKKEKREKEKIIIFFKTSRQIGRAASILCFPKCACKGNCGKEGR
jgi:hypothetical protein